MEMVTDCIGLAMGPWAGVCTSVPTSMRARFLVYWILQASILHE